MSQKKAGFNWTTDQQRAFEILKQSCANPPVFRTFRVGQPARMLRSLTSYQQLMLNRLAGGRVVVLGGEECQGSRGETGLLYNGRYGNDVQ